MPTSPFLIPQVSSRQPYPGTVSFMLLSRMKAGFLFAEQIPKDEAIWDNPVLKF